MSSIMAPNVHGVGAPGRRTVYSMCGMCAVRCPIEVTVEDGRVVWLQGNPHDKAIGASLCAKGSAGLAFEYDDERPQTPLIRIGPRGGGQWRRASWDEALDYIADKLHETIEAFGGRGIALSDRGGFFTDLTRTFVQALGSPNYFNHDATCGGNVHNAARSIFGFPHSGFFVDLKKRSTSCSTAATSSSRSGSRRPRRSWRRWRTGCAAPTSIRAPASAACKATRYWQVRPNSDYALNLAIIHEVLKQEAYDKDFVASFVSGMDYLRKTVKDTTPEWQESHTGVPAGQLRDFVKEIAADAPRVIFHPGWMTAAQAVVLRQPHGDDPQCSDGQHRDSGRRCAGKVTGVLRRKSLKRLSARVPKVTEPRVDGAGTTRPSWDPSIGMLHQLFAAMETGKPYGIGAYFAYRHDPLTGMPDPEATQRALDQVEADSLRRRAVFGNGLVFRRRSPGSNVSGAR